MENDGYECTSVRGLRQPALPRFLCTAPGALSSWQSKILGECSSRFSTAAEPAIASFVTLRNRFYEQKPAISGVDAESCRFFGRIGGLSVNLRMGQSLSPFEGLVTTPSVVLVDLSASQSNFRSMKTEAGKHDQFETAFARHQRQLYRYIVVLAPSQDAAEEVFQQTCYILLTSRDRFDASRDFLSWAQGIARNVVREFLRQSTRPAAVLRQLAEPACGNATACRSGLRRANGCPR